MTEKRTGHLSISNTKAPSTEQQGLGGGRVGIESGGEGRQLVPSFACKLLAFPSPGGQFCSSREDHSGPSFLKVLFWDNDVRRGSQSR